MKKLTLTIAAALISGAAYGHSPCPEAGVDFSMDLPVEEQIAKIEQWRENERIEDEREFKEQQAQDERERTNELLRELIDAVTDLE